MWTNAATAYQIGRVDTRHLISCITARPAKKILTRPGRLCALENTCARRRTDSLEDEQSVAHLGYHSISILFGGISAISFAQTEDINDESYERCYEEQVSWVEFWICRPGAGDVRGAEEFDECHDHNHGGNESA
jgi:hypothetical protein